MKKEVFLDNEEKELIEAYEKWEFVSVSNLSDRKKDLQTAFKATTSKRKSINIRVLESDIQKIKTRAIEEWLPYQTLISQVLHKYSTWKVIMK
jgi:predicted DNA binding CopG/RHH family protein